MKLISLTLRNFRQHAATEMYFPPSGIIGLLGPNEAGKSTVTEAVGWCLFGADAIRETMSSVRWKRAPAKRQAEATLTFEVAGRGYRVWRSEKDAQLFSLVDGDTGVMLASGTSSVNAAIPALVGMRYPEFAASYLCRQRDLNRISAMKPTERMGFIREVLGIGRIDNALERCRTRKNELARELAGAEAGLGERAPIATEAEQAEQAVREAERALTRARESAGAAARAASDAAEALSASDFRRLRHDDFVYRRDEAARERDAAAGAIAKLMSDLDAAHSARARLMEQEPKLAELPARRAEREELRVAEARAGERKQLLDRLRSRTQDVAELEALIAEHEQAIAKHDAAALEQLVRDFRAWEHRLDVMRTTRQSRLGAAQSAAARSFEDAEITQQRIETLRTAGPDEPCPVCTRPLGTHFGEVLAGLEHEEQHHRERARTAQRVASELTEPDDDEIEAEVRLGDLRAEGEAARRVRDDAARATRDREISARKLDIARQELSGLEEQLARLPGVAFDAERLSRANAAIAELETLDRSLAPDREASGRIQVLLEQRGQWESRRTSAGERASAAQADIDLLHFDAGHHAELQDVAARAGEATRVAALAEARTGETLTGALSRLTRAEQALAEYDVRAARIRGTAEQHRIHDRAADALNRFRVAAAATIRPELEELTSGFVALLTDGRHECVELGEDFSCVLHEGGVPVEVISGGTEDIAALALRLAVSQMIAMRAGHPLSLLILDEPFGSLDDVRRQNVLALLRRLASTFEQVLVISHVEETKYACDHAIEIEFLEAEGRSVVRQSRTAATPEREEIAA